MDDVLKINGIFLCFSTFILYNMYLYPITGSWNLILFIVFCYATFFVYDINRDIIFKRITIKENPESSKESKTGEETWQVV
jgi:O-antigen/teichoic acid export membrane protein